jgi:hypothetical protein
MVRVIVISLHHTGTTKLTNNREWAALTLVPTVMLFGIAVSKRIYMPIWTYFVALGFGATAMLPMSFVYAMSGFSIKVGYFNELIYGCTSPLHSSTSDL